MYSESHKAKAQRELGKIVSPTVLIQVLVWYFGILAPSSLSVS